MRASQILSSGVVVPLLHGVAVVVLGLHLAEQTDAEERFLENESADKLRIWYQQGKTEHVDSNNIKRISNATTKEVAE